MRKKANQKKNTKQPVVPVLSRHIPQTVGSDSENLAHLMVKKLISLAIIKDNTNKIYGDLMTDFIFTTLKNNCMNFVNLNLIYHEQDKNSFYSKTETNELYNDWNDIEEPEKPVADRSMTTRTKVEKVELLPDADKIIKEANEATELNSTGMKNYAKMKKNSQKSIRSVESIDRIKEESSAERKKNKNKKVVVELPVFDLEVKEEKNPNSKMFEQLYLEYERQKKEKLKRNERRLEEEKMLKENSGKKKKMFNPSKFTFDPEGNIIKLKRVNIENLKKHYFNVDSSLKVQESKIPTRKKKFGVYGREKEEEEEENDTQNVEIIYNVETTQKFDKGKKQKKEREKRIVGGDNFNLIEPEIGVVLRDNATSYVKKGGMDFLKKFNKFSFDTFSSFAEKTKTMNKSFLPKIKNATFKEGSIDFDKNVNLFSSGIQSIENIISENPLESNCINNKLNKLTHSFSQQSLKLTEIGQMNLKTTLADLESIDLSKMANNQSSLISPKNIFLEQSQYFKEKAEGKRLFKSESASLLPSLKKVNSFNQSLITRQKIETTTQNSNGLRKPKIFELLRNPKKFGTTIMSHEIKYRVNYKDKVNKVT